MNWLTPRKWYLLVFLCCSALLAVAVLWFQMRQMMYPCPLCIFQRVAFAGMGLFALLAFLHYPGLLGRRIYGSLIVLCGLFGIWTAGRHVWLQNLPPELVPGCGPGLDTLLESMPLLQVLDQVLLSDGSCAEISWRFLGLTMPGWCLVFYIGLTLGTLWFSFRSSRTAP